MITRVLFIASVLCFLLAMFKLDASFSLVDLGLALGFGAFALKE